MTMKKSLIAMAVAGVVAAPMAAQAQDAGVYGRVNVGLWNNNEDAQAYWGIDEGLTLQNISSRFGARGEEDLGNGLTAHYRYEFGVDATSATFQNNNRLSWIGLSGDFGMVKAGRIWSAWYDYLGWNTDRSQFLGGTGYYHYGTGANIGTGTRASDSINYTWGGGGYSSDPFTFSVETQMSDSGGTDTDPQDIDLLTLAALGTFGDVQVTGAHRSASAGNSGDPEPSQLGLGVRWNGGGPLYVGGTYVSTDPDVSGAPEPTMFEVLATYDMGGGLSGQLSFSQEDADTDSGDGDTTGVFAQLNRSLSSRTNAYVEFQSVDIDGGLSPQVLLVGMGHNF